MVEVIIVSGLACLILWGVHKVFFSQARMVTQSVEMMKVNDLFRKIISNLTNDIRESTQIIFPVPINLGSASIQITKPGETLRLIKREIDPFATPNESQGLGGKQREVVYELNQYSDPKAPTIKLYKLIRTEYIEDSPGQKEFHKVEVSDCIRDLVIFRVYRKSMPYQDIKKKDDRILDLLPSYETGSGNNLVHLRVTLERGRQNPRELGNVYDISMTTCFYKRGKEVFSNP